MDPTTIALAVAIVAGLIAVAAFFVARTAFTAWVALAASIVLLAMSAFLHDGIAMAVAAVLAAGSVHAARIRRGA